MTAKIEAKSEFKIPKKVKTTPAWLYDQTADTVTKEIADDLISLAFWNEVKESAFNTIRKKLQKMHGPLRGKLFEQKPEVRADFEQVYIDIEPQVVKRLGKDIWLRAKMLAQSADSAFVNSEALTNSMPQVKTRLVLFIKNQGLLAYLNGEFSSIKEFLDSKRVFVDEDYSGKLPSINYQIDFIGDFMLPMLENNGISEELILGIQENFTKARVVVPYLRIILAQYYSAYTKLKIDEASATTKELEHFEERQKEVLQLEDGVKQIVEELVKEIAIDSSKGGLTVREFAKKIQQIGKPHVASSKPDAYLYSFGKDQGIIQISCNSAAELRLIERALGSVVDWKQSTMEEMAAVATKLLVKTKTEIET